MKINKEKVEKLAKLAYLSFDKEEMNRMISDLEEMLHFVNKLEEVNTDDIRPLTHVHSKNNNITRDDNVSNIDDVKSQILENSPNHNSDYIKAPNVLNKK
ncbi:MAG: Asp-tRNA(Asn)/Glu-tRNA(Gln) amidotransferase GatCAB subunit C [Flavobacteriales bacterium]|nr:Asp-tRNA(Asn)/Glu-tRNA(Gln) amidotransferase GatCAB subunit C [Flavobacteriales bacterium]|tara:strand:- start:121 stop:420 length:300 start_codon:yes stop_codon:yes gene_type:complete